MRRSAGRMPWNAFSLRRACLSQILILSSYKLRGRCVESFSQYLIAW